MLKVGFNKHFQKCLVTVAVLLLFSQVLRAQSPPGDPGPPLLAATVTLGNLAQSYNGSTHSATATTTPSGLTVNITYDGSSTPPTNAGSYSVVATVSDPNYQGSNTGTLVISKAPLTATANNQGRLYGSSNPSLTFGYSGFVNAETSSVIDTPPTASTPATGTSGVGGYAITVSGGADNNYNFSYAPGTLTISPAPLTADPNDQTKVYGQANPTLTITYTGFLNGEGTSNITNPTASTTATVSSGVGTYPITLSGGSAANYNLTLQSGTLTITKATPSVSWANPAAINYSTALSATQLNATASVPGTFAYTPAGGTVLNAGANQVLSVNFSPTDAANYNAVNGTTVQITVNKAIPVITWPTPAAITYGTALIGTQLNATTPVPGTFTYTPSSGTLLNAGANQILSVDFSPTDAANYNAVNGTTRLITVNKATPVIAWGTPLAITYGTALSATQLDATANVPGTFTYTPPGGSILNTGVNQILSVNFNPTDGVNYNAVNGTTVQITVNKATPVITWPTPLPIKINVALSSTELNATANVPGTFTYTPPGGTSFGKAGTYTLSGNFAPTEPGNYNAVNNTQVQITVSNRINPVITWADPANITYGTALSATQLNATANVPGTFIYTPASGAILNAGNNQTLSVNFVPTDGVNYNSVNSTAQIKVNKATLTATAASTNRHYGASNPAFTITYTRLG